MCTIAIVFFQLLFMHETEIVMTYNSGWQRFWVRSPYSPRDVVKVEHNNYWIVLTLWTTTCDIYY